MNAPTIYVLAGVNGSGKSSIGGAAIAASGLIYYNPDLYSLRLYDNSHKADPNTGKRPKPRLLLHLDARTIIGPTAANAPEWAKPIIAGTPNNFEQN